MSCEFCNFKEYVGERIPLVHAVGPHAEETKIYIWNDKSENMKTMTLENYTIDVKIEIKFCPKCGKKL